MRKRWALAAVGLAFAAQPLLQTGQPWIGIALLAVAVGAVARSGIGWPAAAPVDRRVMLGGGFVVFLLAVSVRAWNLAELPPVWWDEGVEAYDAQCLAQGLALEPLTGIHYHRSPLWSRVISVSGRWSDFSFGSLRAPSVVAGSIAVALTAAVVARLAGPLPALLASLWLIFHPWELHLSRIMMGNITVPLAGSAIVLIAASKLLPAVRAVVCGLIAGVAVWGYAAALALPVLGMASIWLLAAPRTRVRRRLQDVALCALVAMLVALPSVVISPGMWNKTRQVSVLSSPGRLAENLGRTAGMFHIEGDTDLRHNYPAGSPVFHSWVAPLFTLGIGLALVSPRSPGGLLALGWLLLGLLPGLASEGGAANQFRMAGVPPVAALFAGAGALLLTAAFGRRLGRALAVALVLAGSVTDLRSYFVRFPADPAGAVWFRTWSLDAGRHLARLADAGPVVISPPLNLVSHPLEKAVLFDALTTGRARFGPAASGPGLSTEFRDPWGEPQAVVIVRSSTVRYVTVLDVSATADWLVKAGRPADAIEVIRDALKRLPTSALLRERLGFARLAADDVRGAEREFRAALALRPRLGASWDGLGGALFRQGRFAEAEDAVLEAIRHAPAEPEFRADLSRIRSARAARMNP